MEVGARNHTKDGLLGPNSIMVVYMDPLGKGSFTVSLNGSVQGSCMGDIHTETLNPEL